MTSGERMVWAVAFIEATRDGAATQDLSREGVTEAVCTAASVVLLLRDPTWIDRSRLSEEARAMLDDMLSNGGDR